ncbi:putative starch-binding protein [Trachipleistophora hominis]|uniref:Putative starch-binding protein n=1 Tax=Trachipleistophora hominis TaxID=72359 RepID=L7JV35_TRAHO|nr:putative starch-binding protein [Trachipleistophora hominis]
MIATERENALVIGHRGCGSNRATNIYNCFENTIESFMKAHSSGADAIEFDVHLTKDYVPVIFHNFCVPVNGKNAFIQNLTYAEFLNAGKEFVSQERPHLDVNDHRNVPGTLEDVFKHLNDGLVFNLELKYPTKDEMDEFNISETIPRETFIQHIMKVVYRYKNRRIFFSSFDISILISLKQYDTSAHIFFLKDFEYSGSLKDFVPLFSQELRICVLSGIDGIVFGSSTLNGDLALLFNFIRSLNLKIILYGERLKDRNFVKQVNDLHIVYGFIVDDVPSATEVLKNIY